MLCLLLAEVSKGTQLAPAVGMFLTYLPVHPYLCLQTNIDFIHAPKCFVMFLFLSCFLMCCIAFIHLLILISTFLVGQQIVQFVFLVNMGASEKYIEKYFKQIFLTLYI